MLLIRRFPIVSLLIVAAVVHAGCSNPKEIDYAAAPSPHVHTTPARPTPTAVPTPNPDIAAGLVTRFFRDVANGSRPSVADLASLVSSDFFRNHQNDLVADYGFIADPKIQIEAVHGRYVKYTLDYNYDGSQGLKLHWQRSGRWIFNHGSAAGWVLDSDIWDSVHLVGVSTAAFPTMIPVSDIVYSDGRHQFSYLGTNFTFLASGDRWAITPMATPTPEVAATQSQDNVDVSETPEPNASVENSDLDTAQDSAATSGAAGETHFDDAQSAQAQCPNDIVVWVNTRSGIFHLPGERWYGMTREGTYECESAALAEGDRETRNGQ